MLETEQQEQSNEKQGPLTCSVQEFAQIVGISRDRAYELVHSIYPPPGFKVGKSYRIITERIMDYIDELSNRELENRASKLSANFINYHK